jgi:hypothetical protein
VDRRQQPVLPGHSGLIGPDAIAEAIGDLRDPVVFVNDGRSGPKNSRIMIRYQFVAATSARAGPAAARTSTADSLRSSDSSAERVSLRHAAAALNRRLTTRAARRNGND